MFAPLRAEDTGAGQPGDVSSLLRVVTDFYRRVLDSPRLAHYFAGSAMESLIAHQAAFISTMRDTAPRYSDEHIAEVHRPFHISTEDFEELLELLRAALEDHGTSDDDVAFIIGEFAERRSFVVFGTD